MESFYYNPVQMKEKAKTALIVVFCIYCSFWYLGITPFPLTGLNGIDMALVFGLGPVFVIGGFAGFFFIFLPFGIALMSLILLPYYLYKYGKFLITGGGE